MSDFFRRHFYDTRLLRPLSIIRGAARFPFEPELVPSWIASYEGEGCTLLLPSALARFSLKHDAK